MSILIDDLLYAETQGYGVCGLAIEEIEGLEKSYALLYDENSKNCATVTKQAEAIACLVEALEGLMELEARDRLMSIGCEWDAARAALAKHKEAAHG